MRNRFSLIDSLSSVPASTSTSVPGGVPNAGIEDEIVKIVLGSSYKTILEAFPVSQDRTISVFGRNARSNMLIMTGLYFVCPGSWIINNKTRSQNVNEVDCDSSSKRELCKEML